MDAEEALSMPLRSYVVHHRPTGDIVFVPWARCEFWLNHGVMLYSPYLPKPKWVSAKECTLVDDATGCALARRQENDHTKIDYDHDIDEEHSLQMQITTRYRRDKETGRMVPIDRPAPAPDG